MPQHAQNVTRKGGPYGRLLAMVLLAFIAMYILMYAMVSSFDNVYNSVNEFYMAVLMAAPMAIIELGLMASMYPNKRLNSVLIAVSAVLMALSWFGVRNQVAISDQQFLRSMIPHHAGAILMCKNNRLTDPELQKLCADILSSQQREIDEMKSKLK